MKNGFKYLLVGTTLLGQMALAGPKIESHAAYKDAFKKYVETSVTPYLGKYSASEAKTVASTKLLNNVSISASKTDILSALTIDSKTNSTLVQQRMEAVVDAVSAKKLVEGDSSAVAKSVNETADARLKLIASIPTMGNGDAATISKMSGGVIKAEDVSLAQEVLNKLPAIKVLRMGESEMADYRNLESRIARLTDQGMGLEAASVKAIMEMKNCSYEKAIEYLKKLKGCQDA